MKDVLAKVISVLETKPGELPQARIREIGPTRNLIIPEGLKVQEGTVVSLTIDDNGFTVGMKEVLDPSIVEYARK